MKKPTQTEIAAELGLSKAAISKLKKLGMPVHSADAARAWRAARLHPGRRRSDPGPSPRTLVERATALLPFACDALRRGRFDLVASELKLALRAIPASHREEISLDLPLWDALIGLATMTELQAGAARHAPASATPPLPAGPHNSEDMGGRGCDGNGDMTDAEYAATLYSLACGELRLVPASTRR